MYTTSLSWHTNRKALAIQDQIQVSKPYSRYSKLFISVSEEEIENFSAQGLCDLRWAFATQQWLEPSLEDGNFHRWEWKPTWGDILQCLVGSCNFKQPLMSPKEAISVAPGWVERPEYVPKGRWTVKKKTHAKCPVYGSGSIFAGM